MQKKLLATCLAFAALAAFIATPAASASPVLTETGTAVAAGSSITAKNTGNIFLTVGTTTLACETADLKGTVLKNSGTKVITEFPIGSVSFSGTGAGGDCTSSLSPFRMLMTSRFCFETREADTALALGCGGNIRFSLEFTGLGTCNYHAASMAGTLTTGADATFNFSKQPYVKDEGGAFCPGEGQIDMDFDLTTTDGTTLLIS
ncbi:MAG: hypothetical protein ACTHKT_06000 [Solirubrobacterales bacterium]